MKLKDKFVIYFSSINESENQFEFKIEDDFFKKFDETVEFTNSSINLFLTIDKQATFFEFYYKISGVVTLDCDVTLEPFEFSIDSEYKLIVKFGEEYNDIEEGILELPRNKNDFDISLIIFELVILAIPNKKLHPKLLSGELKSEVFKELEKYLVNEFEKSDELENEDPRWGDLKKIQ